MSPLTDITNNSATKKHNVFEPDHYLPIQQLHILTGSQTSSSKYPSQNIHPTLALYLHDLKSDHMSHNDLAHLLKTENEYNLMAQCKSL